MPWASKWTATFTEPLLLQLMAIIKRDQADAINSVGESELINEFDLTEVPILNFPALWLELSQVIFDAASELTRKQTVDLFLHVAVTHIDPNQLTLKLLRYVRAMDRILESIQDTDWFASLQLPYISGFAAAPALP